MAAQTCRKSKISLSLILSMFTSWNQNVFLKNIHIWNFCFSFTQRVFLIVTLQILFYLFIIITRYYSPPGHSRGTLFWENYKSYRSEKFTEHSPSKDACLICVFVTITQLLFAWVMSKVAKQMYQAIYCNKFFGSEIPIGKIREFQALQLLRLDQMCTKIFVPMICS